MKKSAKKSVTSRRNVAHELKIVRLTSPARAKCTCNKWSMTTSLPAKATEGQAQKYFGRLHSEHVKLAKAKAKENLFGFGSRKQRIAKKKRKAAILTAKAGVLEAKERLKSARKRNPQTKFSADTLKHLRKQFASLDGVKVQQQRAAIDKVFAQTSRTQLKQLAEAKIEWISPLAKNALVARRNPGKVKKNLHPLEVGANAAIILGGLDHVWQLMKRRKKNKKRTKKNCSSSGKSAAKENGAIRITPEILEKYPHLREKLGVGQSAPVTKREKQFEVSWFSPRLNRRSVLAQHIEASNKSGAIAEAKALIGYSWLKRKKKELPVNFQAREVKANPKDVAKQNFGLISLVENLQAADYLAGKLSPKKKAKKKNSSSPRQSLRAGPAKGNPEPAYMKLREDFLGRKGQGTLTKLYGLPGAPKNVGSLAKLAEIQLTNGKTQTFAKGAAYIGGVNHGKLTRMVIGLKQPFAIPNGMPADKPVIIGEVKRFDYWARKPHLYGANSPEYRFTHKAGEEGGRRPLLVFHNGAIGFRGGDYSIEREGVRN